MSKGVIKNYSFNTATKTITLTDIATVRLDKLALITDVTTNKILYNFADSTIATATVSTNTITLSALQGGESNSDKLRIDYDVESTDTSAFTDTAVAVSVSSSALPSGAATSTKQSDGSQKTQVVDGSGNVVTSHTAGSSKGLDVSIIDGSGNQITSFGGGTQYAEGATAATGTGTLSMGKNGSTVTAIAVDSSGSLSLQSAGAPASAAPSKAVQVGGTDGTNLRALSTTSGGVLKVDVSGTAANSTAIKVDASSVAVPITDNSGSLTVDAPVGTPVFVAPTPATTGGWSKAKYAAQTTTVQTVKGTAGTFGGYFVYNPNASVAYIQVFDVASATSVTLGTTTPDMIFGIPATSGANLEITLGVNMANGIKLACTTTATGSTAPGSGLDITVFYK